MSVPSDRRVWAEARSLVRAGFHVSVICPTGEGRDTLRHETIDDVVIHRYSRRESGGQPIGFMLEYGWALWHMRLLVRRLLRENGDFDVVHLCNPPDVLFLAVRSLRRRGARIVFDHHDLVPELFEVRFGRRRRLFFFAAVLCERLTFRAAHVVVAPNESYRRVALTRGRKRHEDTFVVRIAPDLERFRPGPPDPHLKRGKQYLIAYVGTMGYQDGLDHALGALHELSRTRQDWHAVFAGAGDASAEMRALAQEFGLSQLVEFPGYLEDVDVLRLLSTADVCIAPEPKDPLNEVSTMIKVVEYMALGRPIVAYDLAETRFSAGGGALYATPNDEAEFASCIQDLLNDSELRQRLGKRGRERIERDLPWSASEKQLLAAYQRVLGSPGSAKSQD